MIRLATLLIALLWANVVAAQTPEKRVALVVGNARYANNPLANPANDARDVAAALRKAGFTVTEKYDQTYDALNNLLTAFAGSIKDPSTVALFYYAGHGVQYGAQSYLVPIGADNLTEESEIEWRCVPLERITAKMQDASNHLNIIVLDACRAFPVARGARKLQNGLAASGATVPELLIAYATAPGSVADDRSDGANGLFTASLLRHIGTPGYDLHKVFLETRKDVKQRTNGKQVPGVTDNVTVDFYFFPPLPEKPREPVVSENASPPVVSQPVASPPVEPKTVVAILPDMVAVKGGTFRMGSETNDKDGDDSERPAHPVTVSDFEIGKYEVTNREFCQFLNEMTSKITLNVEGQITLDSNVIFDLICLGQRVGGYKKYGFIEQIEYDNGAIAGGVFSVKPSYEHHPVAMVTWHGAKAYAAWLSKKTNLAYRLPSESEWEYAARGGALSKGYKYSGNDNSQKVAWQMLSWGGKSYPVGKKKANELGLYDMSGNVYEWCEDCWQNNYAGHPRDGSAWVKSKCSTGVLRGGSWGDDTKGVRVAKRRYNDDFAMPDYRYINLCHSGFRLARTK